jgi:hypothetical protein
MNLLKLLSRWEDPAYRIECRTRIKWHEGKDWEYLKEMDSNPVARHHRKVTAFWAFFVMGDFEVLNSLYD